MKKQELNFTLGEGSDKLINDIALEKLWYEYDYERAVSFLQGCLMGIPLDIIDAILLKKTKLELDSDGMMNVDMKNLSEGIDVNKWYNEKIESIDYDLFKPGDWTIVERTKNFIRTKKLVVSSMNLSDYYYYSKNPEQFFDKLKDKDVVIEYESLMNCIKSNIEKIEKLFKIVMKFLNFKKSNLPNIYYVLQNCLLMLETLNEGYVDNSSELNLENYIKNSIELDKKSAIEPTKIICDGGWISPEGDYYGLNGVTANFIHLRIAKLLHESGIIDCEKNPEEYIERQGWVKQHHDFIHYAGQYYGLIVTKEQLKTIKEIMIQSYNKIYIETGDNIISLNKLLQVDHFQLKKLFGYEYS